jgi:putative ABC transport system permease protein
MSWLLPLALRSAWSRRFVLSLVVASIGLSTLLVVGIERIRADMRANFAQSVSGTDLIVGARAGAVQLLLYSVFRIGSATGNMSWRSAQALASHPDVAWTIPMSLGDSHRGFPVVATSGSYFVHFRYGEGSTLSLARGKPFEGVFDAVIGSTVADQLGYRLDDRIVLSHGDGLMPGNQHADKPFSVVGILQPTGTPVDRSVHISLAGMQAIHVDWGAGAPAAGRSTSAQDALTADLTPGSVTAVLVGLKSRARVFSVQRWIAGFGDEPLMGVLPGVALDEMWDVVGGAERALLVMSGLVGAVSLAGLMATVSAGLNERRRELAVLRALGASPRKILALLALEGFCVTLVGAALGALACAVLIVGLRSWVQAQYGLTLSLRAPSPAELRILAAVMVAGSLVSLLPGYRAYRMSLTDGLSPRV